MTTRTLTTIEWRRPQSEDEAEEQEACEYALADATGETGERERLIQRIERAGGRLVSTTETAQVYYVRPRGTLPADDAEVRVEAYSRGDAAKAHLDCARVIAAAPNGGTWSGYRRVGREDSWSLVGEVHVREPFSRERGE